MTLIKIIRKPYWFPLLAVCLLILPAQRSRAAEDTEKGWRLQLSGDYFMADGNYDFESDQAPFDADSDLEGDVYGTTLSIGFPKWEHTSWLDLGYSRGDFDGDCNYSGYFMSKWNPKSKVNMETDEFMIRYRSTLWKGNVGVSFNYQTSETQERGSFGTISYDRDFYLVNLDLGYAWHKAFNNGIDFGIKVGVGFGPGYATTSKVYSEDGLLLDAYGSASAYVQYMLWQKATRGAIFLEGGYKGTLYWTYHGDEGFDQTETWTYSGPFVRAGLRVTF
jgi:hypothetical protein